MDATGAGDAFWSGFLYGHIKGKSPKSTNPQVTKKLPPCPSIGAENRLILWSKKKPCVQSPSVLRCTCQNHGTTTTAIPKSPNTGQYRNVFFNSFCNNMLSSLFILHTTPHNTMVKNNNFLTSSHYISYMIIINSYLSWRIFNRSN